MRHLRDHGYPVTLPDALETDPMAWRLAGLRSYHRQLGFPGVPYAELLAVARFSAGVDLARSI